MVTIRIVLLGFLCFTGLAWGDPSAQVECIKKAVTRYKKKYDVPGIAVGLYYKGKTYFYNVGFADPKNKKPVTEHTIFEIGSITKSFTSAILALEINKGTLRLDDPVKKCIPYVKKQSPLGNITLFQLATHTSSLPRKSPVPKIRMTKHRVLNALQKWKPEFPVGSKYRYSNLGYNILGYALEEKTGTSYMQLFKTFLLNPLDMKETFLEVPRNLRHQYAQGHKYGVAVPRMSINALGAAGSLKSTTFDMMKFLRANLYDAGPESLQKALKLTHKSRFEATKYMMQALSWERIHRGPVLIIDKNGGVTGFSTWMGFAPDDQIGLIILTNQRNKMLTGLGRKILHSLALLSRK